MPPSRPSTATTPPSTTVAVTLRLRPELHIDDEGGGGSSGGGFLEPAGYGCGWSDGAWFNAPAPLGMPAVFYMAGSKVGERFQAAVDALRTTQKRRRSEK